jgi:hypothetical protein
MNAARVNGPVCHWIPVTDASGRVRMEMRWSTPDQLAATPNAA